ncbi:MAG TPA: energy transducer TonB, partial [Thermoanaerobaculia bacterium]|nr:energy transducer TonB [Thermoanaerobaculia bacterium]
PEPAETVTRPAAPAPAPTPAAPEPKPEPTVKLGDLVSPGAGVVPPRIVRRPALRYPPVAQRMRKEATVSLSVLVDHNGRVVEVKRLGGEAGFGLDEAAEDYAREISWAPATKNGIKVKMWYELRVAFSLSGR